MDAVPPGQMSDLSALNDQWNVALRVIQCLFIIVPPHKTLLNAAVPCLDDSVAKGIPGIQDNALSRVVASQQQQTQAHTKDRLQLASTSTSAPEEETLWLQLLAKMTGHVAAHLPKIWQLVQV